MTISLFTPGDNVKGKIAAKYISPVAVCEQVSLPGKTKRIAVASKHSDNSEYGN
jgi:hypothetical protein